MKQTDRVLKYLIENKTITPLESWSILGVYRLSSVIHKLRKNHTIITHNAEVKNRFGESCNVACYELK